MKKIFLYIIVNFQLINCISQKTEIIYLSGKGSDNTVNWEFYCTEGLNSGRWTIIPVPSNWELEGFGGYNYGYNRQENRAKEKGLYKFNFDVPKTWKNNVINIVFEGSMTDTEFKINENTTGPIHQGSFYRFRYNITDLLKFGEKNLLEVTVSKISANESVNKAERNADYWIFGGIYRPVYLEILPKDHIEKVAIDATATGQFIADVFLSENNQADEISVQILTLNGEKVGTPVIKKLERQKSIRLKKIVSKPKLWTTEFPNLYNAEFTLLKKGKPVHIKNEKIGFRSIEVRKRDGIYLNGVKLKFKGVNRHCFWPTTGRALSRSISLKDAVLIKDMNMNAVRNSHYPADEHFYEICDSLGIMVFDELGGWHDAYDTEVGSILVKEMIEKSMNHPCVVMWVNGNEGGHNRELLPLYDSLDIQQRPIIQAWEVFRNIDTKHYRDYNYGNGDHYQGHEIVLPTEFLHGLYDGGHGAGLEDFWKLMWDNPLSAGGFLWNLADEAVVRVDKDGQLDSDGNHGADGILGPYREKEGSYFTIKEVWAPIYFEHREITSSFDGTFRIENRFHFTNINQCSFSWELAQMPDPFNPDHNNRQKDKIIAPNIIPGNKDTLKIDLPENWQNFDVLYITATDPHQKEIFTWSWPVSLPDKVAKKMVVKVGPEKPVIKENNKLLIASSNGIKVGFGKENGLLQMVSNSEGHISFNNGPVLCSGKVLFKSLDHRYDGQNLIVQSLFEEGSAFKKLVWTIYPSGWIKLEAEYCPSGERHEFLGLNFSYPEEHIKSIQWMGDGPYRVWKNRMKGNRLDVWEKDYNNTITGQSEYIYPEFKGYHSRMYWLKVITDEQDFIVVTPNEDIFFRMLTPESPDDPYNTAPVFPPGDISFLHGINPIGTKSLQPFRMGPMSEENIYYTYNCTRNKKMTLYFYFSSK